MTGDNCTLIDGVIEQFRGSLGDTFHAPALDTIGTQALRPLRWRAAAREIGFCRRPDGEDFGYESAAERGSKTKRRRV